MTVRMPSHCSSYSQSLGRVKWLRWVFVELSRACETKLDSNTL